MEQLVGFEQSEKQAFIFGTFFLIANKLQVISDQHLEKSDITTKQWFLIAAVQQFGDTPPTLSQISERIGSSRQNVKQLALKLEKNGFIHLQQDSRAVRLVLTEKCRSFWKDRESMDQQFIKNLFRCMNAEEVNRLCESLKKVLKRIDSMAERKGHRGGAI